MYIAVSFAIYIAWQKNMKEIVQPFLQEKINFIQLKKLFAIGIGPALQYIFEVAAFAFAGIMAGWLGKVTLDAHGIALSLAAFTYMFASGVSGATSIRVANFKGLDDWRNIKMAGFIGFGLSAGVMLFFALILLFTHHLLPTFFNGHLEVIQVSSALLLVAALFQLFDGVQVTGLGVLRGLSDVKIPTVIALAAYWVIALPLAYYLGFIANIGIYGVWYGLTAGLIFSAMGMFLRFRYLLYKHIV